MTDLELLLQEYEAGRVTIDELALAVITTCEHDTELFSAFFFPHYCKHAFNAFHYGEFEHYRERKTKVRRASVAPRGYAKSTITALIKPIHDLCYGLERYIVIFSNRDDQAVGKLRDIRNELLGNPLLVAIYGIRFDRAKPAESSFKAYSDRGAIKYEAYGANSEIRGIRDGDARPSKIVLDDIEHSEEVDNEALRSKLEAKFNDVIAKLGDENTSYYFVGTILHRKSLLQGKLDNPMYDGHKYKSVISWSDNEHLWEEWRGILRDKGDPQRFDKSLAFYHANEAAMLQGTEVLWPEKEPYLYLMQELFETGKRSFMKEKQNEPIGSDEKIFQTILWYHESEQDGKRGILIEQTKVFIPFAHMRAYAVMDPATGQTKAKAGRLGDFTCIILGLVDPHGRLFVHSDWTKRVAPSVYIEKVLEYADEKIPVEKFGIETNLYRNLLLPNLIDARKRREKERKKIVKIPFYDIETVENKEKRIYTLEPKLTNGWILFNRALSQEFVGQVEDFPKADHDDCPDALEMLWGLVNNRYGMHSVGLNPMDGR